jgi:hypothetical protein
MTARAIEAAIILAFILILLACAGCCRGCWPVATPNTPPTNYQTTGHGGYEWGLGFDWDIINF